MSIKSTAKKILVDRKRPLVKVEVIEKASDVMLEGRVYLITGGGSGIGYEIARKLVRSRARVVILGRNKEKLQKAAHALGLDNCGYEVCDLTNIEKLGKVMDKVFEQYGRLDGLINNAGVSLHEWDFLKVTLEGFDEQFDTNLKAGFFLSQAYVKKILAKKTSGNIVFVSSERGSMAEVIPYGLTKAMINSLVQGLSYKYYKSGIRVNAVSPGVTATEMTGTKKDGDLQSSATSGRVFLPEEVAEVVTFLLSDYSGCVSGEVIHCNGGNHIKFGW